MKKILLFILSLITTLSITACSNEKYVQKVVVRTRTNLEFEFESYDVGYENCMINKETLKVERHLSDYKYEDYLLLLIYIHCDVTIQKVGKEKGNKIYKISYVAKTEWMNPVYSVFDENGNKTQVENDLNIKDIDVSTYGESYTNKADETVEITYYN